MNKDFLMRSENVSAEEHLQAWRKFEFIEHLREYHNEQPENIDNQLELFHSIICPYHKNNDDVYLRVLQDRAEGKSDKAYYSCDGKFHVKYNTPHFTGEKVDKVVRVCPEFESRDDLMPYDNSFRE